MFEFFRKLFDTADFPPRWYCGSWSEELGWLHIVSDLVIACAYAAIPISLGIYAFRKRDDVLFPRIYWLFALFIFSCGTTHMIDASLFWHPWYRLSGLVKVITAVVSSLTAVVLIRALPYALALPGTQRLNEELAKENLERRKAEDEVRRLNLELSNNLAGKEELVAELRSANAVAENAARGKDEFLAIVSHELRSPLNSIVGWVELLRTAPDDPKIQRDAVDVIERSARAQAELIEDLMDVSRIVAGTIRIHVRPTDIGEVIEAAVDNSRPAADARGIQLNTVQDATVGLVSGDAERLQQIVRNLLSNAIKFTPKGGHVEVRLEQAGSDVQIVVSDDGNGIAPEFVPRLFERFSQADSSSSRPHRGLGLGLAICRQLVELHGGSISAASAGVNQGSTFTVRLPRLAARDEAEKIRGGHPAGETAPVATTNELAGIRVVAVDDDPDARALLGQVLSRAGAEVTISENVKEALESIARIRPHVLLSDIEMPEEDGYRLIEKLRGFAPEQGGTTPAAALTAYARLEDRLRALRAGFQMHIPKPINPRALVAVVANLAGNRASR